MEGHDSAGTHPLRATVTRTQRRPHPILGVSPRGPLTSRGPCPARPGDDNQRQSPTPFWEQTQKSGSALSSAGPAPAPEQEERPAETKLTCGPPAPSEGGRVSEAAIPLKAVPGPGVQGSLRAADIRPLRTAPDCAVTGERLTSQGYPAGRGSGSLESLLDPDSWAEQAGADAHRGQVLGCLLPLPGVWHPQPGLEGKLSSPGVPVSPLKPSGSFTCP